MHRIDKLKLVIEHLRKSNNDDPVTLNLDDDGNGAFDGFSINGEFYTIKNFESWDDLKKYIDNIYRKPNGD